MFLELRKQRNNVSGFTLLLWVLKCSLTSLSILCYFILFFKFWKGKRVCKLCEIINPVKGKGKSVNWGFSPQFSYIEDLVNCLKISNIINFTLRKHKCSQFYFIFVKQEQQKNFRKIKLLIWISLLW